MVEMLSVPSAGGKRAAASCKKASCCLDTSPRMIARKRSYVSVDGSDNDTDECDSIGSAFNAYSDGFPIDRPARHVHFELDRETQEPTKQVYYYPAVPEELFPDVYYSRQDLKKFFNSQRRLARNELRRKPDLVDCIYYLNGYDISEINPNKQMGIGVAHRLLCSSDVRGLESLMVRLLSKRRDWGIKTILSVQQLCRSKRTEEAEQLDLRLHLWSIKVGAAASLFAQRLALVDETEARSECNDLDTTFHERTDSTFHEQTNVASWNTTVDWKRSPRAA